MYLRFSLLLFLFSVNAKSQIVVVNLDLNNCAKCTIPLSFITPNNTHIPTIILLGNRFKEIDEEIEQKYEFHKKGFGVIYSDEILKRFTTEKKQKIAILNRAFNIIWSKDFDKLNGQDIQNGIRAFSNDIFKKTNDDLQAVKNNILFSFNFTIGRLYKIENLDTIKYTLTKELVNKFLKISPPSMKIENDEVRMFRSMNNQFQPTFTGYYYEKPFTYLIAKFYDPKEEGENTVLYQKIGIYKFNQKDLVWIKELKNPQGDSFSVSDDNIVIKGEDLYIPVFGEDYKKTGKHIATYKMDGDNFIFTKLNNSKLPQQHIKTFGRSMVDFRMSSYPYVMYAFNNEVYNLQNDSKILLDNSSRASISNLKIEDFFEKENVVVPFQNEIISFDSVKNELIVIVVVKGKNILERYNVQSKLLISSQDIGQILPLNLDYELVSIDTSTNVLYIKVADFIFGIPLALFAL